MAYDERKRENAGAHTHTPERGKKKQGIGQREYREKKNEQLEYG